MTYPHTNRSGLLPATCCALALGAALHAATPGFEDLAVGTHYYVEDGEESDFIQMKFDWFLGTDGRPSTGGYAHVFDAGYACGYNKELELYNINCVFDFYNSIGTQAVEKSQVAMLMATWQFLNTFSLMVSPLMFRFIYSNSISWMPGLIWFVESGLFLIGFALFFRLPDWTKPQRQRLSLISEEEAELRAAEKANSATLPT